MEPGATIALKWGQNWRTRAILGIKRVWIMKIFSLVFLVACSLTVSAQQMEQAPAVATPNDGSDRFPKVFVVIDKSITNVKPYQNIQIQVLDQTGRQIPIGNYVDKVSTGGGFKNPTGIANKAPYCASTPVVPKSNIVDKANQVYLTADHPEFKFQFIPALLKGPRITMEKIHYSRTFEDDNGDQIPMPYAIHVTGGIYLHEVPPSYKDLLGYAVSGGCVRLHPQTARLLWDLMLQYGGIHLAISGQNPPAVKFKRKNGKRVNTTCTFEMIQEAKARREYRDDLPWLNDRTRRSPTPVYRPKNNWFSIFN